MTSTTTKVRPARKLRAGDVLSFAGQSATVTHAHDCENGRHVYLSTRPDGTINGEVCFAADTPLEVQRDKTNPDDKPARAAGGDVHVPVNNSRPLGLTLADLEKAIGVAFLRR